MPINQVAPYPVHPATYASVLIETQCKTAKGEYSTVQNATGFVYRDTVTNRHVLITNWHVATGRRPDSPEHLLIGVHHSPERIKIWMPMKANKLQFLPLDIDLYESGKPIWLEAKPRNGRIDVVAIPIEFPSDNHVVTVQDFAKIGGPLKIGQDVIVVGFPFGRYEANPFAIWKKAMIASEPSILLSGRPRHFLDTPGRPGMSGSPVYAVSEGIAVSGRAHAILSHTSLSPLEQITQLNPDEDFLGSSRAILRLVGVYSGSYGSDAKADPLRDMGLGFSWIGPIVDLVMIERLPGENPFLPDFEQ